MTCIDWLSDAFRKISARWNLRVVHRDARGYIWVITASVQYSRFGERAFDKIRQASGGMSVVLIRQLDALARVMQHTTAPKQRLVLSDQAGMILQASERSVPEARDRADVLDRYDIVAKMAMEPDARWPVSAERAPSS